MAKDTKKFSFKMHQSATGWGGKSAGGKAKPTHKYAPLEVDRNVNPSNEGKG